MEGHLASVPFLLKPVRSLFPGACPISSVQGVYGNSGRVNLRISSPPLVFVANYPSPIPNHIANGVSLSSFGKPPPCTVPNFLLSLPLSPGRWPPSHLNFSLPPERSGPWTPQRVHPPKSFHFLLGTGTSHSPYIHASFLSLRGLAHFLMMALKSGVLTSLCDTTRSSATEISFGRLHDTGLTFLLEPYAPSSLSPSLDERCIRVLQPPPPRCPSVS